MPEFIKVAELYLVKEGEQYTGLEMPMTENVLNKTGAANLLDMAKRCLDDSSWIVNTVMRVKDAQTNQSGSEDSNSLNQGDESQEATNQDEGATRDSSDELADAEEPRS
jgi:hypothetical protein